jgi:hypothetical protein
MRLNPCPLLVA